MLVLIIHEELDMLSNALDLIRNKIKYVRGLENE